MPKGPQGQKRPADVIGNSVRVMRIATGEETEELDPVNRLSKAAPSADSSRSCSYRAN
jgi:hypothetical protein